MIKCEICNKEFDNYIGFGGHIRHKHNMSTESYYIQFISNKNKCRTCGELLKFYGLKIGYREYCDSCSRKSDGRKNKIKQTIINKYGVENVMHIDTFKEKVKQTNLKKYGCYCPLQNEEIKEKTKKTNLENYGTEHPSQIEEIKNKIRQSYLDKYNVSHPMYLKKIKDKIKQTCLEKYGVDNPLKDENIYNKTRSTLKKNYDADYPLQVEEIRNKARKTNIKRYGVENPFQSDEIKHRIKEINLIKYGVENPFQSDEIKKKINETIKEKYNVNFPSQNKEIILKIKNSLKNKFYKKLLIENRITNLIPLFNIDEYNGVKNNTYRFKCIICTHVFEDHLNNGRIPRCPKCFPSNVSKLEIDIREYIQTIYDKELIFNDRYIISPYELDIVIPDLNIAIEVNGIYYHTEAFGRGEDYHQMKVDLCESAGYKLYYIWEDKWNEEQNNTKKYIQQILKENEQKTYITLS